MPLAGTFPALSMARVFFNDGQLSQSHAVAYSRYVDSGRSDFNEMPEPFLRWERRVMGWLDAELRIGTSIEDTARRSTQLRRHCQASCLFRITAGRGVRQGKAVSWRNKGRRDAGRNTFSASNPSQSSGLATKRGRISRDVFMCASRVGADHPLNAAPLGRRATFCNSLAEKGEKYIILARRSLPFAVHGTATLPAIHVISRLGSRLADAPGRSARSTAFRA